MHGKRQTIQQVVMTICVFRLPISWPTLTLTTIMHGHDKSSLIYSHKEAVTLETKLGEK